MSDNIQQVSDAIASGIEKASRKEVFASNMTLRDHFAAAALAGLSVASENDNVASWDWDRLARYSYIAADAMLKAREK